MGVEMARLVYAPHYRVTKNFTSSASHQALP